MAPLNITDFPDRPELKIQEWIDEAGKAGIILPTAASLASAQLPSGRVSNRMVTIKGLDDDGNIEVYSDFTNSKKGKDLRTNKNVALTFFWQQQNRSIRVEGTLKFISASESSPHFKSIPKPFQASVLLGEQSQPMNDDRQELVEKFKQLVALPESELQIPSFWFGAKLVPDWIEFYQGSLDGVSDRITYTLLDNEWKLERITP